MVSVKYDKVSIAYDDFVAIDGVTLNIPDGEITTLLGPSGCGKSTLLRALAGFVEPFEGHIFLGDREVTDLPPQKRNTAMIFQNYALWPHLTIFKNVEYGLKLRLKQKIVYTADISPKGIIEGLYFNRYGATDTLADMAVEFKDFIIGKDVKDIWNYSLEDILPAFKYPEDISNLKLKYSFDSIHRNAKFLLGAVQKTIRAYYELVIKELPDWIPPKRTKFEKTRIRANPALRFFWVTKPYYWINRKISYMEAKAKVDSAFNFRKQKVEEVLDIVHLADQAEKHPTELSGGQQQRIALARSIVVEPDILLCDEPLSNLDAKLRKELRTEIRSIIKKIGITSVYVTHDQAEALAISDRIAVMNIGFIEQYGTPLEVFTDPRTLFVAQFIGSSSTVSGKIVSANSVELPGGEIVTIATKENLSVGTEVDLVIRPDNILLAQQTDKTVEIEINTIEYLGTEVKLTGLLKDGTMLLVDVVEQAEEFAKMEVGDKVNVNIIPEEIFVFVDKKRVY
jgi:ABC-type Fe3+/spermidine/putrescine transport system ATPase subunit